MNPLTVRIFDTDKVVHRFLDMCTTSGKSCGTAEDIYSKIHSVLSANQISLKYCVGLSVDNAPVNVGPRNSIAIRMLKENTYTSMDALAMSFTTQLNMEGVRFWKYLDLTLRTLLLMLATGLRAAQTGRVIYKVSNIP